MKILYNTGLNRIGKKIAIFFSYIIHSNKILERSFRLITIYFEFIQGKGAGTGWNLNSEVEAIEKYINIEDAVIFDVGANVGEYSKMIKSKYPNSKVHLFEPQPRCLEKIKEKRLEGIYTISKAVSDKIEKVKMYVTKNDIASGIGSLHERQDTYFQKYEFEEIIVDTVVLDQYIHENNITKVDFMKMDIEGHELAALKGAIHSFERQLIKTVTFEFGSGNINSRTFFKDFYDFFIKYGYKIYRITPSGKLTIIDSYYEDLEYFRGVSNYLATNQ